jgi:hypothetical protein
MGLCHTTIHQVINISKTNNGTVSQNNSPGYQQSTYPKHITGQFHTTIHPFINISKTNNGTVSHNNSSGYQHIQNK